MIDVQTEGDGELTGCPSLTLPSISEDDERTSEEEEDEDPGSPSPPSQSGNKANRRDIRRSAISPHISAEVKGSPRFA